MSNFPPAQETEPKPIDDNARKFIVMPLDPESIASDGTISYYMDVYWTDTAEDTETKVVRKVFRDIKQEDQLLRIRKEKTEDGKRKSVKSPITPYEFDAEWYPGIPALQKRRTELSVIQDGDEFVLKYDEFTAGSPSAFHEGTFFMMEVEPPKGVSAAESDAYIEKFDHSIFGVAEEVSGEADYEGYRVVETLRKRN